MGGAVVLLLIGVGVIAATHEPEPEVAPEPPPVEPVAIPEPPPTCLDQVAERTRVEADLSSKWEQRVYFIDGRPCMRGYP
ncbi:hypothetical protein [Thioalkalivibrio sp. ALE16]|uniref:hypothetical protein n=1 Tax=Thioalkalivibrio sp. ALE16 TaxID=1158172 RepID=UPI00036B3ACF|nr:hypothetical protein [Thioalkalivibrio sp. ALE16]